MKVLVFAFYALLLTYSSVDFNDMNPLSWKDIVSVSPESFYTSWYSKDYYNGIFYAVVDVNVRTQPKVDATKLGYLRTGDKIEVTAITDNGWYEVKFNDKRGYIIDEGLTSVEIGTPIKYSDLIYYVGRVTEDEIKRVIEYWTYIPESIRLNFLSDGSRIIVTDENLGLRFYDDANMGVLGVTSFDFGKNNCDIYISNSKDAAFAMLHETGHYLNGKLKYISRSDTFREIWTSEVNNIVNFHSTNIANINSTDEYFAECFSLYISDSDTLKYYCPSTYEFIDCCVEIFGEVQ